MTILGPFPRIHVTWSGSVAVSDLKSLDQRGLQMVNGDDGGTWAPATPLEIDGASHGLFLSGPTQVWGAGFLQTFPSSGARFSCQTGNYPLFCPGHAGATRSLMSSFAVAACTPWMGLYPQVTAGGLMTGAVQTLAGALSYEDGSVVPVTFRAELAVHNGATMTEVVLSFAVPPGATAPTTPPRARILRVDVNGDIEPCTSVAAGADAYGYVTLPAPAGAAAWYNGGAAQTWALTTDQNNAVDISQYVYLVEIVEAQGTTTTVLNAVDSIFIPASSDPQQTLSGAGLRFNGDRILILSQSDGSADPALHGVWHSQTTGTGPWFRPPDFAAGSAVAAGTVVPVNDRSTGYGPSLWQIGADASPILSAPSWLVSTPYAVGAVVSITQPNKVNFTCTVAGTSGGTDVTNTWTTTPGASQTDGGVTWVATAYVPASAVRVVPAAPSGTIWISATTTLTDIPGLAFQ